MAKGKSPGIDGLTSEVFYSCWHFIENDFFDILIHFWETCQLYPGFNEGVLKLIPKKADRQRIKDWRPIAMLNTIYKIIAKLLALHLRILLPQLVHERQTGFVPGRQIFENISITCLAIDWIIHNKTEAVLLFLDFEKAFDRVDFSYIWATLSSLGLGGKFLQLVQGLILGAHVKIYMNGRFSSIINIERGVRQGCPLSPMLFALCTQPLLTYLQHQRDIGFLPGLPITNSLSIGERLFADDMAIFLPTDHTSFQAFYHCISVYEHASGAKLNINKSIALPIGTPTPEWLKTIGCIIAKPGEVLRYLGAPGGVRLSRTQVQDYCLDRVCKRISKWKSKHLSFPA